MADSDKNILITPNTGATSEPTISLTGYDNDPITLRVLDDNTLSFEGSAGQLFSISPSLTGTIFSVNDISGIPSLEIDDDGEIRLAEFSGNIAIGKATAATKLDVNGTVTATAFSGPLSGNASTATALATARTISLTGDATGSTSFDGTANASITVVVADDSHNHIISNVDGLQTALDGKQALDADLTSIAGLSGTSGFLKKTAANTWSLDTNTYLTGNQTITLTGDVSGSGTTSISVTVVDDSHNHIISNVDGLQDALDGKQATGNYLTTTTNFGGDVSGTYGAIVVVNDSHTHAGSNLTGTSLASGIVTSSLTTVGTIGTGVWQGTAIADAYIASAATWNALVTNATHTGEVTGSTALTIASNVVDADNLKVTGNGTTSQFLRSDGDGTFTWAIPTDTTYSSSDFDHNSLTNTHNLTSDLSPAWGNITSKPSFATVATSGSYTDLSNKPSIAYSSTIAADAFTSTEVTNLRAAKLDDGTTPWTSYLPLSGGTLSGDLIIADGDVGRIYGGIDNNDYIEIDGGAGDYIKFFINATETLLVDTSAFNVKTTLKQNGTAVSLSGHTHTASNITNFDTEVANNSAVTANTAKETNVTTNISVTQSGNTVTVNSSDGTDGTIAIATTTNAGVMSTGDKTKLDGIATSANNYTHPTHPGDDFSVDTGALTGATVVSDIDINVTTDTSGHVTDANGVVSTRTLTPGDIGAATSSHTHSTYDRASSVLSGANVFSNIVVTDGIVTATATRGLTKSDIGLGNVPNLDFSNASNITSGTLSSSVLPPVALTEVHVVVNEAGQLGLTAQEGDVAVRSDQNKTYMHNGGSAGTMADWTELQTPTDSVLSVNGETGTVVLTQDDIGNGSTYVQTANNFTDALLTKLNGIDIGAEVNQNAFSNIAVSGQTTVSADSKTDTLTFIGGSNVSLTTNATNDEVTINAVDTTYDSSDFNHDSLTGFVSNEHIDHTGVSIIAGTGLSGGGDISASRTLSLDFSELTDMTGDISGTTEFILQNGTTESRKAASEIKLSNFNNNSGWTSYAEPGIFSGGGTPTLATGVTATEIRSLIGAGTVTSVATSGAITGGTITTTGTISHSTASGYKHIPSGGSSNQFLKYSADGTAVWAAPSYTTSLAWGSITDKPSTFTPSSHTHGNITNAGAIGSTAGMVVITTTSGVLTTADATGIDDRNTFPIATPGTLNASTSNSASGAHTHSITTTSAAAVSTIVQTDASGDLTAASKFKFGSNAYIEYNSTSESIDFVFV